VVHSEAVGHVVLLLLRGGYVAGLGKPSSCYPGPLRVRSLGSSLLSNLRSTYPIHLRIFISEASSICGSAIRDLGVVALERRQGPLISCDRAFPREQRKHSF